MKTTIDSAGRIVVPKALRDELGLSGGQELDVLARDGRLEIEVASTEMRLERKGRSLVAIPDHQLPPLTDAIVRETLERVRR